MVSVLILGAGASRRAGYPTAQDLLSEIRTEASHSESCQYRSAWQAWEAYCEALPPGLEVVRHCSNPEIVLSLPDLFAAAADFEDEFRTLRAGNHFQKTGEGTADDLQEYFSSKGRKLLGEAKAARARLLESLDWYFSFRHHDDSQKHASERDYLREHLNSLVRGDAVITFNWDTLAERALAEDGRWCPVDGYGFPRQIVQRFPDDSQRSVSAAGPSDVVILKLHGSYGWRYLNDQFFLDEHGYLAGFTFPLLNASASLGNSVSLRDAAKPSSASTSDIIFAYPSFLKQLAHPILAETWARASEYLWRASFVEIIGYSLPASDSAARALLLPLVQRIRSGEVHVVIQDPSSRTLERWKTFLGSRIELRQEEL